MSQRQRFTMFGEFLLTQQLTKLSHFLRKSGEFLHGGEEVACISYCLLYL